MKYFSKYSNDKTVTAAQYITEIICENKAKNEGKDLHFRFWTNKEWSAYYRNQIATANQLVQKYPEKAIINALKNKKAEKIYSLRAPHLVAIIEQEMDILETANTELSKDYDRSEQKTFKKSAEQKNSIISKLKELE
jgi:hypothetical protein